VQLVGFIGRLYKDARSRKHIIRQKTCNMTLKLQYYFVLTSRPCEWATRLSLFYEVTKAGHLCVTKANLLDVQTVQVLRDELTCKKETKDGYRIEEILPHSPTQHIYKFSKLLAPALIIISGQRSQKQLVHILFIARCSLKLTTCFGISSIRPSSGHMSFIEETIQYM
jgi:hypothetical protein